MASISPCISRSRPGWCGHARQGFYRVVKTRCLDFAGSGVRRLRCNRRLKAVPARLAAGGLGSPGAVGARAGRTPAQPLRLFTRCETPCPTNPHTAGNRPKAASAHPSYLPFWSLYTALPLKWRDAACEKDGTQTFHSDFFRIFGVERRSAARYEAHVAGLDNRSGYIDLFLSGVAVIEQKDAGRNLSRAYDQAGEYFDALPEA